MIKQHGGIIRTHTRAYYFENYVSLAPDLISLLHSRLGLANLHVLFKILSCTQNLRCQQNIFETDLLINVFTFVMKLCREAFQSCLIYHCLIRPVYFCSSVVQFISDTSHSQTLETSLCARDNELIARHT